MDRRRPTVFSCSAALIISFALLGGCSDEKAAGDSVAAPTNTPAPTASAGPKDPRRIDKLPDGPLEPAVYALPPLGRAHDPVLVVDVPEGYAHWGPVLLATRPSESEDPLAISLWVVTDVFKDACKATARIPAGDSVRSIADAFLTQKVLSVTKPRPVTLAGYHGLYLEIAAPTKVDLSHCEDAELNFWESRPTDGYWTRMPGIRDRLWILDVDGKSMVLAMSVPPSADDEQIGKITDILDGARFTSPRTTP